jgi:hypothetical protein
MINYRQSSTSSSISTAGGISLLDNFEVGNQFEFTQPRIVAIHYHHFASILSAAIPGGARALIPKSTHFLMQILPVLPLNRFVGLFRMSPEMLVEMIDSHAVFHRLDTNNQAPCCLV